MDKEEARTIAAEQLRELRTKSYEELRDRLLDESENVEVFAASGARYRVGRQAVLDGPGDVLRVIVAVDDGGLRAFAPVNADFLISPQGTFIDEQRTLPP